MNEWAPRTSSNSNNDDNVARAYDQWAATYDSDRNATRDLDAAVLRASGLEVGGRTVLELGCGTGKNTVWLAERAARVIAIDFSAEMLAAARRRVTSSHVEFLQRDVRERLPLDDAGMDVVVCNLVLEHVADVAPVFAEIHRVLHDGGAAFLCELHPERQRRGGQAQFTDAASGDRVFVEAYTHTIDEFVAAASGAGLVVERMTEHLEDGAPADAPPRLLAMLFRRLSS